MICPRCKGSGVEFGGESTSARCPSCGGRGEIEVQEKQHKPCPFCNSTALSVQLFWSDDFEGSKEYFIRCDSCSSKGPDYATEAEAWAAWDRRVDEKDPSVAPKPDPWEEMDRFVKDTDGWGDTRLSMIWEELKATRNPVPGIPVTGKRTIHRVKSVGEMEKILGAEKGKRVSVSRGLWLSQDWEYCGHIVKRSEGMASCQYPWTREFGGNLFLDEWVEEVEVDE